MNIFYLFNNKDKDKTMDDKKLENIKEDSDIVNKFKDVLSKSLEDKVNKSNITVDSDDIFYLTLDNGLVLTYNNHSTRGMYGYTYTDSDITITYDTSDISLLTNIYDILNTAKDNNLKLNLLINTSIDHNYLIGVDLYLEKVRNIVMEIVSFYYLNDNNYTLSILHPLSIDNITLSDPWFTIKGYDNIIKFISTNYSRRSIIDVISILIKTEVEEIIDNNDSITIYKFYKNDRGYAIVVPKSYQYIYLYRVDDDKITIKYIEISIPDYKRNIDGLYQGLQELLNIYINQSN